MQLLYQNGLAREACTWVVSLDDFNLPDPQASVAFARSRMICVGFHRPSRQMIFHFTNFMPGLTMQDARKQVYDCLRAGGGQQVLDQIHCESMDRYHGERFGLIAFKAPTTYVRDEDAEESEESSDEAMVQLQLAMQPTEPAEQPTEPAEQPTEVEQPASMEVDVAPASMEVDVAPANDIFAVAVLDNPTSIPSTHRAGYMIPRAQAEIEAVLQEARGGELSKFTKSLFFGGDESGFSIDRAEFVRQEAADQLREQQIAPTIVWQDEPQQICIYEKKNMRLQRRKEWVLWRFNELGNLPDSVPGLDAGGQRLQLLFAIFLQVSAMGDAKIRMASFKAMFELNWKELAPETRAILRGMNAGKSDLYCRHCRTVLLPGKVYYCSRECSREYCWVEGCREKLDSRMVTDWQRTRLQQRLREPLHTLSRFLDFYADLQMDYDTYTRELFGRRKVRQCCPDYGPCFIMDSKTCKTCIEEFQRFNELKDVRKKIESKVVTWGECRAAQSMLLSMSSERVEMVERFCVACEHGHKPSAQPNASSGPSASASSAGPSVSASSASSGPSASGLLASSDASAPESKRKRNE